MCTILQQANKPIKKRFQSFLSPPLLKFVISATTTYPLFYSIRGRCLGKIRMPSMPICYDYRSIGKLGGNCHPS